MSKAKKEVKKEVKANIVDMNNASELPEDIGVPNQETIDRLTGSVSSETETTIVNYSEEELNTKSTEELKTIIKELKIKSKAKSKDGLIKAIVNNVVTIKPPTTEIVNRNECDIKNTDGINYLKSIDDDSINLVLTDPPYITSRKTGMDEQAKIVKQFEKTNTNLKSEKEWKEFKTDAEWVEWMIKNKISEEKRESKLKKCKENFLKYGSLYGKKYAVVTDYGEWDNNFTMELLEEFITHYFRVLKNGGTLIIFFDIWKITPLKEIMEKIGFKQIRFIEWVKTNPQPLNSATNYLTNCREIALLGIKKSKPTFNSKYDKAIYEYPLQGGKNRFHPTQKSLPLFEDLIKKHSNENDVVLDTFLGSGTTAIAAKNTNRQYKGCEISKEYYDKIIKLLE